MSPQLRHSSPPDCSKPHLGQVILPNSQIPLDKAVYPFLCVLCVRRIGFTQRRQDRQGFTDAPFKRHNESMDKHNLIRVASLVFLITFSFNLSAAEAPQMSREEIFAPVTQHVHGSTLVELPNGDLLVAWFQGSGERRSEDVAIRGSRLRKGSQEWSTPFLLADTADFPDINPVLFIDPAGRQLFLYWYTVIAHQWDTSLLKTRVSEDFTSAGKPTWKWQDVLHVKPGDSAENGIQPNDRFVLSIRKQLAEYREYLVDNSTSEEQLNKWDQWAEETVKKAQGGDMRRQGRLFEEDGSSEQKLMGYPYFRRMGWQTRNKPTMVSDGRMLLPLYSDGFDFSLIAITDDLGESWSFSDPLLGPGNIQPTILERSNGELVAYMRDNGPPPKRLHISVSQDRGESWSAVRDSSLPNPGSAADGVRLSNGHWVIVSNNTERGRNRLSVALSQDEGRSWPHTRDVEFDDRNLEIATSSHYPAIIQGKDGLLHLVYSSFRRDERSGESKTIKYARFNEAWIVE